jgi:hypothetical protein
MAATHVLLVSQNVARVLLKIFVNSKIKQNNFFLLRYENRHCCFFIDKGLAKASITKALDNCLLSGDDVLRSKVYWGRQQDSFPKWEQE